jgi:hypothetical protein
MFQGVRQVPTLQSAFVFGLTVAAIVAAAVPAVAAPSSLKYPGKKLRSEDLPAACYVIFPTERDAAGSCPIGIKPTKVYDFWQHTFLGWSCDCGPTDSLPNESGQSNSGSDDPIDV